MQKINSAQAEICQRQAAVPVILCYLSRNASAVFVWRFCFSFGSTPKPNGCILRLLSYT